MERLKKCVCAANLELYRRNLALYTWGNVSQIDREAGIIAIKPSGIPYEVLTPEKIVLVCLADGAILEGSLRPSSDTPTHLVLYRAFPEIGGVTHTHSPYATAWAQAGRAIPCLGTTHADYFYGDIPITRPLTPEEVGATYEANTGKVIVETFAGQNPMLTPGILARGHGPFTWGQDAMESVHNAVILEEIAKMALWTDQLSPNQPPLPHHIAEKHFMRKHGSNAYYGQK